MKVPLSVRILGSAVVIALAMLLGSAPAQAAPASASRTVATATKVGRVPTDYRSCVTVAVGLGSRNPWALVEAAANSIQCGAWLGRINVNRICWESRQWWGYWARGVVRVLTGFRYSRC